MVREVFSVPKCSNSLSFLIDAHRCYPDLSLARAVAFDDSFNATTYDVIIVLICIICKNVDRYSKMEKAILLHLEKKL